MKKASDPIYAPIDYLETPAAPHSAAALPNGRPRWVLAVGRPGETLRRLQEYAREVGERNDCRVMLLILQDEATPDPDFVIPQTAPAAAAAGGDTGMLTYRAAAHRLYVIAQHLRRSMKRVEFIITDAEDIKETLAETALAPVFRIEPVTTQPGGSCMSSNLTSQRTKDIGMTIVLGVLSVALYAAVFSYADQVTRLFTRGGAYAALPIMTVFVFSFAHGAFASRLWSLLGIQARPKIEAYKNVQPTARPTKKKSTRPRVYAHVNPFHNIDLKGK